MESSALLDGLDEFQRAAVTAPVGLVAVVATAGSGKTTVLSRRIAHRIATGSADARHTVAITFTRDAASELHRRLQRLGLHDEIVTGTFHATAFALLRQHWTTQHKAIPQVISERWRPLREAVAGTVADAHLAEIISEIDWARARALGPGRYEEIATTQRRRRSLSPGAIAAAWKTYETFKSRRRLVDLDDLLVRMLDEMRRDETFTHIVRWRLRHFHVDEAQDLNPLQHAVLEAWRAGRDDLFLVGDPAQAIYGWNGAEPRLLREVEEWYPQVTVLHLDRNRRSTPEIVAAGRAVLATTDLEVRVEAVRPPGTPITLLGSQDEAAEAQAVARWIRDHRPLGTSQPGAAVLVRTNAQIPTIVTALEDVGLTVPQRRGRGPWERAVQEVSGLGGLHRLVAWANEILGEDAPPPGPEDELASCRRRVASLVDEFVSDTGGGDSRTFVGWLRSTGAGSIDELPGDGVEVLTFHAAKGREWPCVAVAGFEQGLVPHSSARQRAARDEEIRLAYVALSRASDVVLVSWAHHRQGQDSGPSPLVEAVRPVSEPIVAPPPGPRSRPDATLDQSPTRLTALRRWRAGAARSARVPAEVICSDTHLAQLAQIEECTLDDIAGVIGSMATHHHGQRILTALQRALTSDNPATPDPRSRISR